MKSLDQDEDLCSFSPDMTPNSGSLQWNVRDNKTSDTNDLERLGLYCYPSVENQ